jgi:hypothetical protein
MPHVRWSGGNRTSCRESAFVKCQFRSVHETSVHETSYRDQEVHQSKTSWLIFTGFAGVWFDWTNRPTPTRATSPGFAASKASAILPT